MIHLRGRTADVVLDESGGTPVIVHWGAPLGDIDPASIGTALDCAVTHGMLDVVAPVSVVPEHGSGFHGRPGLAGHRRGGTAWAARFAAAGVETIEHGVIVTSVDAIAGLRLVTRVELDHALVVQCTLVNEHDTRYLLDALMPTLPLPVHASELLTFTGRWTREMHPVRAAWGTGAVVAENRRGRTSHEHVPLAFAGETGFGEWRGEVWGAHLAWSGNHQFLAEVMPDGRRYLQAGELLQPGEISLDPGESYTSPELIGVYSAGGLTPASWCFHRLVRSRPGHPATPRPVLLNTWEAVYFQHDTARLQDLATAAAALGIERFVLDDGWFGSRRDDRHGLGDWTVSHDVYPDGLAPLIDHVRSLGMEFGIWVEPEMVNPDSDLYRAHPDWVLTTPGYDPVMGRHQLVLDLGRPEAFEHVLGQLDVLLRDHDVAYVKWDMNRDHVQASGADGAAGTHAQTLAVHRLLDELRRRHPSVEIESCASGGGRIDLEILRRTQRVWTSDCNDPLERQTIQRGASMLIPPEVMGAHIGPPQSHTTARTHSLSFRAITALFGHLGVEWNVLSLSDRERDRLTHFIALHQRFRPLLHGGDVVRFDAELNGPDPSSHAHGVYAADRTEALVAIVQLRTGMSLTPPVLRLPDLLPDVRYQVELVELPSGGRGPARRQPAWAHDGITLTGRQLAVHGIQPPAMHPEAAALVHLSAVSALANVST
jgi:alpha-galactosidase